MGEVRADFITISKTDSSQSGGLLGPQCHETTKAKWGLCLQTRTGDRLC